MHVSPSPPSSSMHASLPSLFLLFFCLIVPSAAQCHLFCHPDGRPWRLARDSALRLNAGSPVCVTLVRAPSVWGGSRVYVALQTNSSSGAYLRVRDGDRVEGSARAWLNFNEDAFAWRVVSSTPTAGGEETAVIRSGKADSSEGLGYSTSEDQLRDRGTPIRWRLCGNTSLASPTTAAPTTTTRPFAPSTAPQTTTTPSTTPSAVQTPPVSTTPSVPSSSTSTTTTPPTTPTSDPTTVASTASPPTTLPDTTAAPTTANPSTYAALPPSTLPAPGAHNISLSAQSEPQDLTTAAPMTTLTVTTSSFLPSSDPPHTSSDTSLPSEAPTAPPTTPFPTVPETPPADPPRVAGNVLHPTSTPTELSSSDADVSTTAAPDRSSDFSTQPPGELTTTPSDNPPTIPPTTSVPSSHDSQQPLEAATPAPDALLSAPPLESVAVLLGQLLKELSASSAPSAAEAAQLASAALTVTRSALADLALQPTGPASLNATVAAARPVLDVLGGVLACAAADSGDGAGDQSASGGLQAAADEALEQLHRAASVVTPHLIATASGVPGSVELASNGTAMLLAALPLPNASVVAGPVATQLIVETTGTRVTLPALAADQAGGCGAARAAAVVDLPNAWRAEGGYVSSRMVSVRLVGCGGAAVPFEADVAMSQLPVPMQELKHAALDSAGQASSSSKTTCGGRRLAGSRTGRTLQRSTGSGRSSIKRPVVSVNAANLQRLAGQQKWMRASSVRMTINSLRRLDASSASPESPNCRVSTAGSGETDVVLTLQQAIEFAEGGGVRVTIGSDGLGEVAVVGRVSEQTVECDIETSFSLRVESPLNVFTLMSVGVVGCAALSLLGAILVGRCRREAPLRLPIPCRPPNATRLAASDFAALARLLDAVSGDRHPSHSPTPRSPTPGAGSGSGGRRKCQPMPRLLDRLRHFAEHAVTSSHPTSGDFSPTDPTTAHTGPPRRASQTIPVSPLSRLASCEARVCPAPLRHRFALSIDTALPAIRVTQPGGPPDIPSPFHAAPPSSPPTDYVWPSDAGEGDVCGEWECTVQPTPKGAHPICPLSPRSPSESTVRSGVGTRARHAQLLTALLGRLAFLEWGSGKLFCSVFAARQPLLTAWRTHGSRLDRVLAAATRVTFLLAAACYACLAAHAHGSRLPPALSEPLLEVSSVPLPLAHLADQDGCFDLPAPLTLSFIAPLAFLFAALLAPLAACLASALLCSDGLLRRLALCVGLCSCLAALAYPGLPVGGLPLGWLSSPVALWDCCLASAFGLVWALGHEPLLWGWWAVRCRAVLLSSKEPAGFASAPPWLFAAPLAECLDSCLKANAAHEDAACSAASPQGRARASLIAALEGGTSPSSPRPSSVDVELWSALLGATHEHELNELEAALRDAPRRSTSVGGSMELGESSAPVVCVVAGQLRTGGTASGTTTASSSARFRPPSPRGGAIVTPGGLLA